MRPLTIAPMSQAEHDVQRAVEALKHAFVSHPYRHLFRSVLLIGGYGRGEGGVLQTDDASVAHNNLDVLVVLRLPWRQSRIQEESLRRVKRISDQLGIPIDVGMTNEQTIRFGPAKVMWYDARFGHRLIFGDSRWLSRYGPASANEIPAWDIRNLMTNRGTLLLLNQIELTKSVPDLKMIRKHAAKAIIGFGDAILHATGRYHHRYTEKSARMMNANTIPVPIRRAYANAIRYRFSPQEVPDDGIHLFHRRTIEICAQAHLHYESIRLKKWHERDTSLSWQTYEYYLRKNRNDHPNEKQALLARAFPFLAFPEHFRSAKEQLMDFFPNQEPLEAYLKLWGYAGDTNFKRDIT